MRALPLLACAILALATVPMPAQAQAATGILYLSNTQLTAPATGQCSGVRYALDQVAPGADLKKAYADFSNLGTTCRTYFDFVTPTALKLSGKLTFEAYYGCDQPEAINEIIFRAFADGTELSSFTYTAATLDTCTGPSTLLHQTVVLDSKNGAVKAGGVFSVSMSIFTSFSAHPGLPAGQIMFIATAKTGAASSISGVGLPAGGGATGPAALATTYSNITGTSLSVVKQASTSTTQQLHYNWTVPAGDLDLTFSATIKNGTAAARVKDASGKLLYDKVLTATTSDATKIAGLVAGRLNITVTLTAFMGNVSLQGKITQPIGATTSTSGSSSATATGTGTTTQTGTGTTTSTSGSGTSSTTSKGSPNIGYAAGIALLAAIAVARRRLA